MNYLYLLIIYMGIPFTLQAQWTAYGNSILSATVDDACGSAAAVSDSGRIIAVGTPFNDISANNAGLVNVYSYDNGNWSFYGQTLYGATSNSRAGSSVALNKKGSIVAVGSPFNGSNGAQSGMVELYQFFSPTWIRIGLSIQGEAALDQSGTAVSLSDSGHIVAIGAPFNDGAGANAGQVRVFAYVAGVWQQIGNDIDGEMAGDQFGTSLSLSADGSMLAVGAPFNAGNGAQSGHVRVFQNINNNWIQIGSDIDGEWAGEQLGTAVDLSADGTRVVAGAVLNDDTGSNAGQVQVFELQTGTWQQLGADLNGSAAEDAFGTAVSMNADGNIIAVGAPYHDPFLSDVGQVVVYQLDSSSSWQALNQPIAGTFATELSGSTVELSRDGGTLLAGAPGYSSARGILRCYRNPVLLHTLSVSEDLWIKVQTLGFNAFRFVIAAPSSLQMQVYDLQGRLQQTIPEVLPPYIDWQAEHLSAGLYVVRFSNEEKYWTGLIQLR